MKEVDYIIDNSNKAYISSILNKKLSDTNSSVSDVNINKNILLPSKYRKSGRMIIKIQDGCQRFCSFCIVPYLRGLPSSVPIQKIVSTLNNVSDLKEAVLVAINTEAYGYDMKDSFIDLINAVVEKTTVPRISFGSVHPWSVNNDFIAWYKKNADGDRVVKFFHIPLQSGSNKILNLMKRGYTREEHMEKLKAIAGIDPFTFIGTDIITGFLEETDRDFEDTYKFLEVAPISKFHVFRFSKRSHTAAFYMTKRLTEPSPQIKAKRSKALIALGNKKYEIFLQKHVLKTFPALFIAKREDGVQEALLHNQIPVKVKTEEKRSKQIKPVTIKSYKNGTLFGTIA